MKYSIVMPCLLREERHRQVVVDCVNSVVSCSSDYELIIVDDGSPLMTGFLMDIADTYIRHSKSMGIAPSWNDGISASRGDFIVVINDDIVVNEGWLDGLSEPFIKDKTVGVTAPAVFHQSAITKGRTGIVNDYTWFPGYCFMLSREVLNKIGRFDEQFVPYNGEDVDYWQRILEEKMTLTRNFDVVINHREGDVIHSLGNYNKRANEAVLQFVKKHGFDPVTKFYPAL